MGYTTIEGPIGAGGLAAVVAVLLAGLFVGLTPGAYLAGPAVLSYLNAGNQRVGGVPWTLLRSAAAYVVGAAVPSGAFGLLAGVFGDVVLAAFGERVVLWYLIVAVVAGVNGVLLSGLVVARLPSFLPLPRPVATSRDAFLLGVTLGLAACPSCTPLLFPIGTLAAAAGGPLYGAALLFLFGLARGVPVLVAALSLGALQQLKRLIPVGLSAQRVAGWLLLATAVLYLVQVALIVSGRPALFV